MLFYCYIIGLNNIYSDKVHDIHKYNVKGIYLSKAPTCMNPPPPPGDISFKSSYLHEPPPPPPPPPCTNKNRLPVKETDTPGHIVARTIHTSHTDHITPQHTALEQSTVFLSVPLEPLPGLIPPTMLLHTGWTLEKTTCMNMTYNNSTTIFRSIFAQNVEISGG